MVSLSTLLQSANPATARPTYSTPGIVPEPAPDSDIVVRADEARQMDDDTRSPPSKRKMDELIPRQGMFGLKGTMRDILGLVGDAFLVGSGGKAIYSPQREKEKLASAAYGFASEDPQAQRDAANRVTAIDAEQGMEMVKQIEQAEARKVQAQSVAAYRETTMAGQAAKRTQQFGDYMGRMFLGSKSREQQEAVLNLARKRAAGAGINLEKEFGIANDASPEEVEAIFESLAAGATSATRMMDEPYKARAAAVAEKNAASNATRANRPPQPRAAPQPTTASMGKPLLDKIERGEKLTPGQQEKLDRLGLSKDRGKGSRRAPPPLPPGFGPVKKVSN